MTHTIDSRRFDVDWLRSLAFLLLIFYHIGMFYVFDWGWHVKSAYQSEFLQNLMLLLNRWRMPLIFLISGIALSLVEHKISARKLLKLRFVRIFVPLVVGMYLIVPPQLYFELVQNEGFNGGYFAFLAFYINPNTDMYTQYHGSPLGLLTWNHLWYLTYLWHYTLIYLILRPLLTRINWSVINQKVGAGKLFIIWWSWVVIVIFWLKADNPITHNLVDDWYNHAISFSIFLLGYCLPKCKIGWDQIITHRRKFLIGALFGYAATLILHEGRLGRLLDSSGVDVSQSYRNLAGDQFNYRDESDLLAIYAFRLCRSISDQVESILKLYERSDPSLVYSASNGHHYFCRVAIGIAAWTGTRTHLTYFVHF